MSCGIKHLATHHWRTTHHVDFPILLTSRRTFSIVIGLLVVTSCIMHWSRVYSTTWHSPWQHFASPVDTYNMKYHWHLRIHLPSYLIPKNEMWNKIHGYPPFMDHTSGRFSNLTRFNKVILFLDWTSCYDFMCHALKSCTFYNMIFSMIAFLSMVNMYNIRYHLP